MKVVGTMSISGCSVPGPGLWGFVYTWATTSALGAKRRSCLHLPKRKLGPDLGYGRHKSRIQTQHGCSDPQGSEVPLLEKGQGPSFFLLLFLQIPWKAFPSSGKRLRST